MIIIRNIVFALIATGALFTSLSCGGGTTPGERIPSYHSPMGVWMATYDEEHNQLTLDKDWDNADLHGIQQWMSMPEIEVLSYNPATRVLYFDCTVKNTFPLDAHDFRIIVYDDNAGCELLNADYWTPLFRISEDHLYNPFKAFAKDEPNRIFKSKSMHTEMFQVCLPEDSNQFCMLAEVSKNGNCEEPYGLGEFRQTKVYPIKNSECILELEVFDWQDDATNVYFHFPEMTTETYSPFTRIQGNLWSASVNNLGDLPAGEYTGIIGAGTKSFANLGITKEVKITVSEDLHPPQWLDNVGIIDVIPGDSFATVYFQMAIDYEATWFVRYLIYTDTDDYPWDQEPQERAWYFPTKVEGLENGVEYFFGVRVRDNAEPPNIDTNTKVLSCIPSE